MGFKDPDGRKPLPTANEWTDYTGGKSLWSFLAGPGRKTPDDIKAVIDSQEGMGHFQSLIAMRTAGGSGGGGSSTMIGDLMRSVGITLGSLESFMQMNVVLSLRQQLVEAGFKNPEITAAKFEDALKMLSVKEISRLGDVLNHVANQEKGSKVYFKETKISAIKGKSNGYEILLNIKNIKNILELGYIVGHEIGHSIDFYFRPTFFEIVGSHGRIANNAFSYFSEYMSYSWEEKWGSTSISPNAKSYTYRVHGPDSPLEDARYPQQSIDLVNSNLNTIMKYYNKFLTIPKN